MKKIIYLFLVFPILTIYGQYVGINTSTPQASLHVNGNFKFVPKAIDATRLVGVIPNGGVKEFELGDTFDITDGTLNVTPSVDPNMFLIGDLDQSPTAASISQYNNYDIGVANINIDKAIIRVTGETGGYNITGFSDGYDGRIIYYYNAQNHNLTFFDTNSASDPKNQILTGSGANVGINAEGVAEFIYDGSLEKWILINVRV